MRRRGAGVVVICALCFVFIGNNYSAFRLFCQAQIVVSREQLAVSKGKTGGRGQGARARRGCQRRSVRDVSGAVSDVRCQWRSVRDAVPLTRCQTRGYQRRGVRRAMSEAWCQTCECQRCGVSGGVSDARCQRRGVRCARCQRRGVRDVVSET
jgi:hypothetical protein